MARLQIVRGKYVYVTVWLPSKKTRRRIYLGAFGDDPPKLLRFQALFREPGVMSEMDVEALRLDLKDYVENTMDPNTRMTKPELAINWALEWYYKFKEVQRKSGMPMLDEDLEDLLRKVSA